jgi:hypothetical protein
MQGGNRRRDGSRVRGHWHIQTIDLAWLDCISAQPLGCQCGTSSAGLPRPADSHGASAPGPSALVTGGRYQWLLRA